MTEEVGVSKYALEYAEIVREALESLAREDLEGQADAVSFKELEVVGQDGREGESFTAPIDGDAPPERDASTYICKLMEYTQSFLVAERMGRQMNVYRLMPNNYAPTNLIEVILKLVGRGSGKERATRILRYYPLPHLQSNVEVPFVDFAGFLTVILSDFLRWRGGITSALDEAAIAEINTAIEFIISDDTILKIDNGVAWAFIPGSSCDGRWSIGEHVHPLPTAWALTAIQHFLKMKHGDPKLKTQARERLSDVLKWLRTLYRSDRLFWDARKMKADDMVGHNYITESLLTLAEIGIDDSNELAVKALHRLIKEMDDYERFQNEFERNTQYMVWPLGRQRISYLDRTTWATLLSTLALGVPTLQNDVGGTTTEEHLSAARMICTRMANHIAIGRRNTVGLWQSNYLQFHWVMTAVEALLRYASFAQPDRFNTSTEAVSQAIGLALSDPKVVEVLRRAVVQRIKATSRQTDSLEREE